MKIGVVFAGQGAQYPGMGKDLYDNYENAKKIFEEAGPQVMEWCFNSDKETLRQTHITQPCVYTTTMAAYKAFEEHVTDAGLWDKLDLIGLGGFSLGEYAALTAGGAITDIEKGMDIVAKRGELMEAAGKDENGVNKGGMVAAFGNGPAVEAVVEVARKGRILQAVNYNNPKQTVVAGEFAALDDFVEEAKKVKMKAVRLSVGTAFHCEMMAPAAEALLEPLKEMGFQKPVKPIYSNITAEEIMKDYKEGDDLNEYLADIMSRQVKSPVVFEKVIRNMIADGAEIIVEIGPGTTLSNFVKKIDRSIKALHIEDHESLEATIATLKEAVGC